MEVLREDGFLALRRECRSCQKRRGSGGGEKLGRKCRDGDGEDVRWMVR
jgi:hypothetical protein